MVLDIKDECSCLCVNASIDQYLLRVRQWCWFAEIVRSLFLQTIVSCLVNFFGVKCTMIWKWNSLLCEGGGGCLQAGTYQNKVMLHFHVLFIIDVCWANFIVKIKYLQWSDCLNCLHWCWDVEVTATSQYSTVVLTVVRVMIAKYRK